MNTMNGVLQHPLHHTAHQSVSAGCVLAYRLGLPHNAEAKFPAQGPSVPFKNCLTVSLKLPFHSAQRPP